MWQLPSRLSSPKTTVFPFQLNVAECQNSTAGFWMCASTRGAVGSEMSQSCPSLMQAAAARWRGRKTLMSWHPTVGANSGEPPPNVGALTSGVATTLAVSGAASGTATIEIFPCSGFASRPAPQCGPGRSAYDET